tara:strand:+ start:892 stop:1371 length:480 start_codon:yes stop_codon:yes gene_type:complete
MIKKNLTIISILIFIVLILISAYIVEFGLGHKPCKLCVYQRVPYFLAIFLIAQILYIKKLEKILLLTLSLLFFVSFILAFYHFGIEQGFFQESIACYTENLQNELTKEQILKKLKQSNISCKNVDFRIFGLSLASINSIFSITLSVIFLKLFFNYGKNK